MLSNPSLIRHELNGVEIHVAGKGYPDSRHSTLVALAPRRGQRLAYLQQVHSARVCEAQAGDCGRGDALWTDREDLALCVATADCLPIVLSSEQGLAVIHAGWRGIVRGVIPATVERFSGGSRIDAWVGPAISGCCYEVGRDVADEIAGASTAKAIRQVRGGGIYVDLIAAASHQLSATGVRTIETSGRCTYCDAALLWSYRRHGQGAGRNYTFAWLNRS